MKFSLAQANEGKGNLSAAAELYEQVGSEADDELSAMSLCNMGNVLYANGKYEEALLYYLRVAILYQNLANAPVAECMFKAGDCLEKVAEVRSPEVAARLRERARKYYLDVMNRFRQSDFAKQAQLRYQQLPGPSPAAGSSSVGGNHPQRQEHEPDA